VGNAVSRTSPRLAARTDDVFVDRQTARGKQKLRSVSSYMKRTKWTHNPEVMNVRLSTFLYPFLILNVQLGE
jgi:hypothetical protein